MLYFIDGYNFLFFYLKPDENLQKKREELIEVLDEKLQLLKIEVILVFDGFNTLEKYPQRSYFQSVNVVFTPQKQTADDYIIEQLSSKKNCSNITVVTADKNLAQRARHYGAHTKTPKAFLLWAANNPKEKNIFLNDKILEDSKFHIERLLKIFEKRIEESTFE